VPGGELIRQASTPCDIAQARELFEEYAASLDVDLCFQNFAQELASLPGAYAPPQGRLLLAGPPALPVGCAALRPLSDPTHAFAVGEIKRLYVRPEARGAGVGRSLIETLLADARSIGYRELKLDTLEGMTTARALYAALGFRECEAYYRNPLHGTVYMMLALE
jgi:putative acetyltransferase